MISKFQKIIFIGAQNYINLAYYASLLVAASSLILVPTSNSAAPFMFPCLRPFPGSVLLPACSFMGQWEWQINMDRIPVRITLSILLLVAMYTATSTIGLLVTAAMHVAILVQLWIKEAILPFLKDGKFQIVSNNVRQVQILMAILNHTWRMPAMGANVLLWIISEIISLYVVIR